jgi:hypothetical protein
MYTKIKNPCQDRLAIMEEEKMALYFLEISEGS